jgi:hypothetical protein
MTDRCLNCNGILTKTDKICYCCGDKVPKWVRSSATPLRRTPKRRRSFLSNMVFLASLALTAYTLLATNKPPLKLSLAASGVLLLVKVILDLSSGSRSPQRKAAAQNS